MRTRWPWISLLLSAALVFNPVGLDILHSAFFAGEQLARSIGQAVVMIALAIMAGAILFEWLVRVLIFRRRARGAST
ncbi:hypothetical protein JQ561_32485 [Bradyrhizobium diazoefficiens]|uniref:hypothetical protein n=1 Tax=Bradyrhizobium sp. WYCCWR 12699 TaxID=3064203 RepID=UPI001BACF79B|nr:MULTISPECIES: hypothetical protein [Bradyrhizobium]MBR0931350.1 hypothetical protein [Bradyrhizobium diazoefficiens]MDT4737679.1 hypothetical protein [Bradyrhizobium sp. WYCCWR 12699]